jgi:pyrroline-5-carboxylate reductase
MKNMSKDLKNKSLAIIGCGNMGEAILRSWLDSKLIIKKQIHVVEPNATPRNKASLLGVHTHEKAHTLPDNIDLILLAVKPQNIALSLYDYSRLRNKTSFISIVAGTATASLQEILQSKNIIRAIPNIPAIIQNGSTIFYFDSSIDEKTRNFAKLLFSMCGKVHEVATEELLDAVTAISGSGPGYIFYLMECLISSAIDLGINETLATNLVKEVFYGSSMLALMREDQPLSSLRRQVTSPNGTTQAGLDILTSDEILLNLFRRSTLAAHMKAREL